MMTLCTMSQGGDWANLVSDVSFFMNLSGLRRHIIWFNSIHFNSDTLCFLCIPVLDFYQGHSYALCPSACVCVCVLSCSCEHPHVLLLPLLQTPQFILARQILP